MSQTFEPETIVKLTRCYALLHPLLLKFPKPYRHTLGLELSRCLLFMMEQICEANVLPLPFREAPLVKAVAKGELFKLLVRICLQTKLLNTTQYAQLQAMILEILKMLMGWIAFLRQRPIKK